MVNTILVGSLLLLSVTFTVICSESGKNNAEVHMDGAPTTLIQVDKKQLSQELKKLDRLKVYRRLTGSTHTEIAAKINKYVASHSSVSNVVPCSDLDVADVAKLAADLRPYIDTSLRLSLPEHDGRQTYLNPWKVDGYHIGSSVYRDALCTEVVKLWSHHIRKSAKQTLEPDISDLPVLKFVIPSLPVLAPDFNRTALIEENFFAGKSVTCIAGHSAASDDTDLQDNYDADGEETGWPHWPYTFHFLGKGYGPYPFWQFGFSDVGLVDGWTVNESFSSGLYDGTDIEMWHSTPLQATKFFHAQCRWDWLGFGDLGRQPCAGLQLKTYSPKGKWFLFTVDAHTKRSNERFCCEATCSGRNGQYGLGTINRKFMDNMKYVGEEDFNGHYYNGRAKLYLMSMIFRTKTDICPECDEMPQLPIDVWLETDLLGRPLRFGELGQDIELNGYLHDTDLPLIYEEMNPNSFNMSYVIPDKVFEVPKVCLTNTHSCAPGRDNRERPQGDHSDAPVRYNRESPQ